MGLEYRPKKAIGLTFAAAFFLLAGLLFWLGIILRPEDKSAMDGFTLLLFTMIPIRLFSWTCAGLFILLSYRVGRMTFKSMPSLAISETSLTLASGEKVPWTRVRSARVTKGDILQVEIEPTQKTESESVTQSGWFSKLRRKRKKDTVLLSSFDLGASPEEVEKAIRLKIEATPSQS